MATNRAGQREAIETRFAPRLAAATAALLLCASLPADAEEPAKKPQTPQTTAEAKPDVKSTGEFKPPPGFRAKKRGDVVVYCRKESALGSRFAAEKCYDRAGLRGLELAELEKTEMLERVRACGSGSCSAN